MRMQGIPRKDAPCLPTLYYSDLSGQHLESPEDAPEVSSAKPPRSGTLGSGPLGQGSKQH